MSASQKWRPPVAPKPVIRVGGDHDSGAPSSSALKGATHAFGSGSPASSAGTGAVKSPAVGARDAATTADKYSNQDGKHGYIHDSRSPVRGRSQLSLDLKRAAEYTAKPESKNPLQRTASEIAARAASASSSPVRGQVTTSRQNSPRRFRRSPSQDSTASRRGRLASDADTRNALLGATLSMSASPPAASPFSTKTGKLDFSKIPSLTQQVASPVTVQRPAPVKPQPHVDTDLDGHAESKPEPPQPPPKRQPQRQARQEPERTFKSPASAVTPTVTLSKPEAEPKRAMSSARPAQKASEPVPVPPKRNTNASPSTSVSPHAPATSASRSPRGNMTANDLANAMVGASLASSLQGSRAASPAKYAPPPVPRRRSKSVEFLRPDLTGDKNPPLKPFPKRTMKHTLRKQSPEVEEEEDPRRGRKHRIRKHPHMHNEGDRKRWRDKVSEAERKRYEGVWAANRGLLHERETSPVIGQRPQDSTQEEMVLNVVVRDIWSRSRLPNDALEEIWDLVSPEPEYRALNRERFVVGLWLVDQRLKGRKLPVKVSASVWQSVQLVGIKISSKPF